MRIPRQTLLKNIEGLPEQDRTNSQLQIRFVRLGTDETALLLERLGQKYDAKISAPGSLFDFGASLAGSSKDTQSVSLSHPIELTFPLIRDKRTAITHSYRVTAGDKIIFLRSNYDPSKEITTVKMNDWGRYGLLSFDKSYRDLSADHWGYQAVRFSSAATYLEGIGDARFEPDRPVTRAEFTTILTRVLDLQPKSDSVLPFEDVPEHAWYAGRVNAAFAAGMIDGVTDTEFRPDDRLTREQLAVLLVRLADRLPLSGYSVGTVFADFESVSGWAKSGVRRAAGLGLVHGKEGGLFDPQGLATRAEIAQVLFNLLYR